MLLCVASCDENQLYHQSIQSNWFRRSREMVKCNMLTLFAVEMRLKCMCSDKQATASCEDSNIVS